MDADDLTVAAAADLASTNLATVVDSATTLNELTIDAPTDGILVINGSVHLDQVLGEDQAGIGAFVDDSFVGVFGAHDLLTDTTDSRDQAENLSYTTAIEVTAGSHTVRQDVGKSVPGGIADPTGVFTYEANNLTVMFIPNGTVTFTSP